MASVPVNTGGKTQGKIAFNGADGVVYGHFKYLQSTDA